MRLNARDVTHAWIICKGIFALCVCWSCVRNARGVRLTVRLIQPRGTKLGRMETLNINHADTRARAHIHTTCSLSTSNPRPHADRIQVALRGELAGISIEWTEFMSTRSLREREKGHEQVLTSRFEIIIIMYTRMFSILLVCLTADNSEKCS